MPLSPKLFDQLFGTTEETSSPKRRPSVRIQRREETIYASDELLLECYATDSEDGQMLLDPNPRANISLPKYPLRSHYYTFSPWESPKSRMSDGSMHHVSPLMQSQETSDSSSTSSPVTPLAQLDALSMPFDEAMEDLNFDDPSEHWTPADEIGVILEESASTGRSLTQVNGDLPLDKELFQMLSQTGDELDGGYSDVELMDF